MMQRQMVELESSKLQAFGRATTILFLLYNILTSSVFGMFACFDMDYGDRHNRFDQTMEQTADGSHLVLLRVRLQPS